MQALLLLLIVTVGAEAPVVERYPEATEVYRCVFDTSDDKNFDGWPDGWTRRRGRGFPQFVKVGIVEEKTPAGSRCLRIDLDGAGAVAYSPAVPVGPLHSYVLEGLLKTEDLQTSRAWLSLSLLNENRERLETYSSEKIQHTQGWRLVRLGPISPSSDEVRLAVLGLHLEPGSQVELKGSARFADVWLGRLPRMSLSTTAGNRLVRYPHPIQIACSVSGVYEKDPPVTFRLDDALGKRIAESPRRLKTRQAPASSSRTTSAAPAELIGKVEWDVPVPGPGFFRVSATMKGQKDLVHRRELALAVIESPPSLRGIEFGWSLPQGDRSLSLEALGPLIAQAGIGRVKLPLWCGQQTSDARWEALVAFHERLTSQGIEVIGLLSRVPAELRRHFDDSDSPTAADVFSASPKIWYPSLEVVLTRLSGQVRAWQLGDDKDTSFVGYPDLAKRLADVKAQLEQAMPDLNLGIGWGWMHQLPAAPPGKPPWRFLSLSADPPLTDRELGSYLAATKQASAQRWVVLEPLPRDRYPLEVRLNDLVQQILACKVHGADGIFLSDPLHAQRGLIDEDGGPSELFLPWRTTALMLAGARYLGTLQLPSHSDNLVFARGGQATMVAWNPQPARETLYLGEDVRQVDLWGRAGAPDKKGHLQVLQVGPLPLFATGLDEPVARWSMDFAFERERIPSVFGIRHKNSFRLKNHFGRSVSGTAEVVVPEGWSVEPRQTRFRLAPGDGFHQALEFLFPYDAQSGRHDVRIDFTLQADRAYRFSVHRHIDVGLQDVYLEIATRLSAQGELLVEQQFVNETAQGVSFTCELFVPERQRQKTQVTGLGQGRDLKTYRLPDGKPLIGKTLWLRAEEIGGPRVLNYRFVAEP